MLRLGFVLSDQPPPVQFDARIYVSSALALSLAVSHPSIIFDKQKRQAISYDLIYADFLSGEQVEWLYYDPPEFETALKYIYFAGPVYPSVLGIVFWPDWGHDFAAARLANVLFDLVSCLLLFWVLLMTAGRTAARLGAAFFAFYPGFIIKCGELNLEPLAGMLTLLAVALSISAIIDARPRRFFYAGIVTALLMLTKAAATGLIAFLIIGVVFVLWRNREPWLGSLLRMAGGYAVLAAPWVFLIWFIYGTPGVRDPEYGAANFRSSNILPDRGYDLDNARVDFWTYPVWREIYSRPGEYALLYLEKFYRLWNRSYNDYRVPLLVGVGAQIWFHRILLGLAIIGLFFWPQRGNRYTAIIALAAIAFVSVIHTFWHSLTRYALPALPLVIGAAAIGALTIRERLKRGLSFSRWGTFGLAALVTYLVWGWLDVGRLLAFVGSTTPGNANLWVTAIRGAVLVFDFWLLWSFVGWRRRTVWAFAVCICAGQALLWAKSIPREHWAEWSTDITAPDQVIERVIELPPGFDWGRVQQAFMLMDIQSGGGEDFTLQVMIDSVGRSFTGGTYSTSFYPKGAYLPFLKAYGMKREQIRHWVSLLIPPEQLSELVADNEITVRLATIGGDEDKNRLTIYGEYRPASWDKWVGPNFWNSSVERLYEEDDPRVWEQTPRKLVGATNRRLTGAGEDTYDLSEQPGLQTGDYRFILLVATAPGQFSYF